MGQLAKHYPFNRLVAEEDIQDVQFVSEPLHVEQFGVQVVQTDPFVVLIEILPVEQLATHCLPSREVPVVQVVQFVARF